MMLAGLLLLAAMIDAPPAPAAAPDARAAPAAKHDGSSRETAIKVKDVAEEYRILKSLGLQPAEQALVMVRGHPYDVLTATDPRSGETRKIWFDIASFYGRELGD